MGKFDDLPGLTTILPDGSCVLLYLDFVIISY